jgi:hypothetical protein
MQTLIITSIAGDKHPVLKQYAKEAAENKTEFIIAGDKKSPANFSLEGAEFLSAEKQTQLGFRLANELPFNHYARKNIAYLQAIKNGSEIIIETDDDNIPYGSFWEKRKLIHPVPHTKHQNWVNIYEQFFDKKVWTRGFPLELINEKKEVQFNEKEVECPIQQGLADDNPDVDAAFRLTHELPVKFKQGLSFALGKNAVSPFNSQNTTWFRKAFPLLYLPSYCSFRMTDIWRSFIAQRIAWSCGWSVLYHSPTVYQERNEHNILKDFEDEIPGYLNNAEIMRTLQNLDLKSGEENISENLMTVYKKMVEKNWITNKKELVLLENWIKDIQKTGF